MVYWPGFFCDDGSGLKVDDDLATHAERQQRTRRVLHALNVVMGRLQVIADDQASLDFIDDQVVREWQGSDDDGSKVWMVGTDEVHAGRESGGPCGFKNDAGHAAPVFTDAVHLA